MTGQYDHETPGDVARDLADEARVALGRVRSAWPQLAAARLPGSRAPIVDRPTDRRNMARAADEWRLDRAAAFEASRHRRVISGHHPAPGNLEPIEARHTLARDLGDLAGRLWSSVYGDGLVLLVRDRFELDHILWCTWCGPSARCPRCTEEILAYAANGCPACGSPPGCDCDRVDITAQSAMGTVADLLDVLDVEAAADAEYTLLEAAYLCDRVLRHKGPARIRLHDAECPACGSRELFAATSSPDPREWAVRCQADNCLCDGPARVDGDGRRWPACPCGIATPRRAGRRHLWPSRTWDGPTGLAQRLGIALPGTARYTGPRIPRRPRKPAQPSERTA